MNDTNHMKRRSVARHRRVPHRVAIAIAKMLENVWDREAREFIALPRELQKTHLFNELLRIDQWLRDGRDTLGQERRNPRNESAVRQTECETSIARR